MKTKSYTISYSERLPGKENSEIQYACSFKITPKDPPGREFCFDISLDGLGFCGWASLCGLEKRDWEEYAELVALHCGKEETISALNGGIEQDGFNIELKVVPSTCRREDLERKKIELQKFRDKHKTISHTVTVKKPNR